LKTRKWEEVRPALLNMVEAARQLRTQAKSPTDAQRGERKIHA
jgi:5-methyltetrahydropteroyltriglutamate--homocysteine methyltransferase